MHHALEKLAAFARREGIALRQSYLRVAKRAAITAGRYSHISSNAPAGSSISLARIATLRLTT